MNNMTYGPRRRNINEPEESVFIITTMLTAHSQGIAKRRPLNVANECPFINKIAPWVAAKADEAL